MGLHCTKNRVFFFQMFWKDGLSKKIALKYDLFWIIREDDISFSRNMILFFRCKKKDALSQKKYLEIWCLFQIFWKDGLSKKFGPEHGIFCNIWKYGISFFREIWYFFLSGKWKKVIFINKYMEIWYFLYICINVTTHQRSVALLAKKKQCPRPENIRLKVTFPASLKKIIFILENVVFLLKYHIDRRPRKGSRSSHRRCSIREGVVPGSLFKWSYRLEACNFIKKEALAQLLSCEYCEISKNTFFTEHLWAAASGVLMILCYFMETFIDVFIYCLPMKKK